MEQRFREAARLRREEAELGEPQIAVPDLSGKQIVVIGASKPSGFGYNFAKVAVNEGNARALLTASSEKRRKKLVDLLTFEAETGVCDVRNVEDIEKLGKTIDKVDVLLVTPAYLNPKYFVVGKTWDDVLPEDREECREITVYPLRRFLDAWGPLLDGGVVYGVSFSLPLLPGYTIGQAKLELEELARIEAARRENIRVNILSLGPFPSVSASVIPVEEIIPESLSLPSFGEMVRESVATIKDSKTGLVYDIGGLRGSSRRLLSGLS